MKTIRDAVHGDIRFSEDHLRLIDTVTFQRLRGIKQLGTSSLVYPSAVHTRFEHSLGTAWLTQCLVERLSRDNGQWDEEQARAAVLAALLHDVTHVPFGHTFEDERRLLDKHDRDPDRLCYFLESSPLAKPLSLIPGGEMARDLLLGREVGPPALRQIVTGTVCADLLDYLRRDAFHCGIRHDYDERLLDYFSRSDGQLVVRLHKGGGFRHDVLSELIHLLQLRYTLTERVYYHHAKVVSGAMISLALERALAGEHLKTHELYHLRDDSLLQRLWDLAPSIPHQTDLMEDLLSRRLYKRVYMLAAESTGREGLNVVQQREVCRRYHLDAQERRRAELTMADRLGVPDSHVIIYCPAPAMQLKEADIAVELSPGQIAPLSALGHPDVMSLSAKHRGLWRMYVLIRRDDSNQFGRAGECAEDLIGIPNQIGPLASGEWNFPVGKAPRA